MDFWKKIIVELDNDNRVALLYVLISEGSSPGRQGFKMMVSETGFLNGSIGGGMMEYNLVEKAKKIVKSPNHHPQLQRLVHRKNQKDGSGLICSGEQTVALYLLSQNDIPWLNKIIESKGTGILNLTERNIDYSPNLSRSQKFTSKISTTSWQVQEDLGYHQTLHIIGGGHVSLALSQLAPTLDFKVYVYDDRKNINTFLNNPNATIISINHYKDIAQFIPQGDRHYVVIMSFMFDTDLLILRKLLPQKFKYLGMMGSKQKVKTLLYQLKKDNYLLENIRHLQAPIGIQIFSQTPKEIAISILAEMIKIKNKKD